jgi:lipopolysaccharide export system protein LptA
MNERSPMPLTSHRPLFVSCFFILCSISAAQTNDRIVVLDHADSLVGLEIGGEQAQRLTGNVKFTQGKVVVTCDKAIRYLRSNKIDFEGHVVVRQDSLTMTAKRGTYHANEKVIEAFEDVHLDDGKTTLQAEYGKYFVDEKKAHFTTNVTVHDSSTTLSSNELTYYRDEQKSIGEGNVHIYNAENRITLIGDHFENDKKQNYSKMTVQPMAVEVDTGSDGVLDTLIVTSRLMESYQDSLPRLVANDSVTLTHGGLSAKGGFSIFYTKADSIVFYKSPVVWYTRAAWETTQVSGDSMFVKLNKRRLERLYVHGRAFAISRADSLHHLRYNQMSGQALTMYFMDNAIQHIEVDKTATVFYYAFDGKKPNGANKTSGDHVSIMFLDKKANKIKVRGGVEGQYFPEKMIKNKENEYNLPGFKRQQQFQRTSAINLGTHTPSPFNTTHQ